MRIVHITRRYLPMVGGIERYVRDVATGQARRGHDVTVVTLDSDVLGDVPGKLPARQRIDGVRVVRLPGVGNRRFAICLRPDRLVAEIRRADVVHHHDLRFMTALIAVSGAAYGRPTFLHSHGLLFHTTWASLVKNLALRFYFAPLFRVARMRIIASSEPDRELLVSRAGYLAPQVVTLDNATELAPLLAIERRAEPGLVVAPGRVARHKSLEDLIRALAEIKGAAWRLEISGSEDKEERHRLESIVGSLRLGQRVAFHGAYTDEEHLDRLSRASLAVFPSRHEGFGLALLEAMAAGVPILARDIPAHRAVLGPELAWRLFSIERPRDLARAIERQLAAVDGERVALERRERKRAAEFDIGRLLDQIDGLYAELGLVEAAPSEAPGL